MIEHLIATEKSNCSLKRLFIEIGHFACTVVIRKKLGVFDVKHLTKLKAPPWQNTQLPFGALGCDSGDITGSKVCLLGSWFHMDPFKPDAFGDDCRKPRRDIRDRTCFPCQDLLQSQPQCRFQTGSMSSALGMVYQLNYRRKFRSLTSDNMQS